jgi:hypothetical protein
MRPLIIAAAMAAAVWIASGGQAIAQAQTERRVALVVGNGAYQNVSRLANAPNDADAMAQLLARIGFEVETAKDQSQRDLGLALRRFSRRADGAEIALFFYAGHGIQANDVNYLLPIDSSAERPEDLRFDAVDIGSVLEAMQGAHARLLFLDACRNNPLADRMAARSRGVSRGLARIETSDVGTLIAFATAPGTTADDGAGPNSPFTSALVENLSTPGLEVHAALTRVRDRVMAATGDRQVPWENSSLRSEVYLVQAAPPAVVSQPQPPASAIDPIELRFWESAERGNALSDYQTYLRRYPAGNFAEFARNRIAALQDAQAAAPRPAPVAATTPPTPAPPPASQPPASQPPASQPSASALPAAATPVGPVAGGAPPAATSPPRTPPLRPPRPAPSPAPAVAAAPAASAPTAIDRLLIAPRATGVRAGPSETAPRIGQLAADATAPATGRTQIDGQTWYRIAYQGHEGWIAGAMAREIDPAEVTAWNRARESRQDAALEEFLRAYPRGYFADRARARLAELRSTAALPAAGATAAPPPGAPAAQGLLPSCGTPSFTLPVMQTMAATGRTRRNQGCTISVFRATQLITPPQHGTVTIENGILRYQPASNFKGSDVFQVGFVSSPGGVLVSITVEP